MQHPLEVAVSFGAQTPRRAEAPDLDNAIAEVVETYRSAVYAKDVDAFMRLYDSTARVFDMWGVWSYEGAEAWRGAVEGWFGSLGAERVRSAPTGLEDMKAILER